MMHYFSRTAPMPSSPPTRKEDIPPPTLTTPFDESPPAVKLNHGAYDGDINKKTKGTAERARSGCPNSCGDCFNTVQEPLNTFFTNLIFPSTANLEKGKLEGSMSQTLVDGVPMVSILDKNLSTVCSFASTLTSRSSNSNEYTSTRDEIGRRLTPDERKQALDNCRFLRLQIGAFEENFTKEHGRMPSSSRDKAPLVDIYTQYREGKRCIREDAACRIQALCRGAIVRMRATKKTTEARVDELLENADLEDVSLLTTEMIVKYITPEERKKIATKVLSEQLYHHKDELSLALPENAKDDEYMCSVCEMPKLSKKDGEILDECAVCPALNKKIIQKIKDQKKSAQLMEMERKKLAYEKEKLQRMKQQMEEERNKIAMKVKADKAEGTAETFKEKKAEVLGSASAIIGGSTNRSISSGSLLREPLEERAKKRLEEIKAEKAISDEKKEYGFGEESFSTIINNLRADLKNGVNVPNTIKAATTSPDCVQVEADKKKKDVKSDEDDEFDDLLEDPEIAHVQRKIRGCPSPYPSEGATAPEDYVSKNRNGKKSRANDNDDDKSFGGFATKAEYDKFQETFREFERDHANIIDYMRKKVGSKGRGERKKSPTRRRSSSAPSFSSDDSREFERCHDRRSGHRHLEDYYNRRGGRRHERRHRSYDYDSDTMSDFSYPEYYERRRHHSSRSRRHRYHEYDRYDQARRYARHNDFRGRYYKGDYEYESRRRGCTRPRDYSEYHRDYESRRRGKERGNYHGYSSYSSDSGEYFSDDDRRVNHSRRRHTYAKEEGLPKTKSMSRPLGFK